MFSKKPTKAELRNQLQAEVSQFLRNGGSIKSVEMGATGLIDGKYNATRTNSKSSPQTRTPVHGLLAAIDARRTSSKKTAKSLKKRNSVKKTIYDDFGEPVRTIWVDE